MADTDITVEQFFEQAVAATFQIFDQTTDVISRDVLLAGIKVRLKFSGSSLPPYILPAIEQITADFSGLPTACTIFVWDSFTTGIDLPRAPVKLTEIKFNGEITGFNNQRFKAVYLAPARMLCLLDLETNVGIVCMADVRILPGFEMACPLRCVFNGILKHHKISMVHTAAVGNADGAVLIAGHGGAGKSSTALRCLIGGLNYFGDDVCAISIIEQKPVVFSVYSSGKIHTKDLGKFANIKGTPINKKDIGYEKEIFFLGGAYKNYLPLHSNIKAVLIPDQSKGEIGFSPVSPDSVLSVIWLSTAMLLPDTGSENFLRVASILQKVPFYRFHLGDRPEEIPGAVNQVIKSII